MRRRNTPERSWKGSRASSPDGWGTGQAYGRDWAGYQDGSRQKMELWYADNANLALDVKIFFKMFTAEAVRKMK